VQKVLSSIPGPAKADAVLQTSRYRFNIFARTVAVDLLYYQNNAYLGMFQLPETFQTYLFIITSLYLNVSF